MSASLVAASSETIPQLSEFTPIVNGVVTPGQTVTRELTVDASGASLFFTAWTEGELNVILRAPDGTEVTPATAGADPSLVRYESAVNSVAYPAYAAYYFANTLPGPWQVVITSDRNDGVVIPFAAYAVMEANRRLSVVKDAALHQAGGTAIITATLLTGEQAIDGAGIVAVVERPDAITETLQFESLGSGEYVARFQLPNVGGYYTVAVRARGSDQGQEFTREVNFLLAVSTADAQFTGAAQDSASDENNDGVLDSLQVDIGDQRVKARHLRGLSAAKGHGCLDCKHHGDDQLRLNWRVHGSAQF